MLELFTPYMFFISFFITVIFNLWLIRLKLDWVVILIANLLLIMIMEFLGIAEYNFLNKVLEFVFDFIARLLSGLFEGINDIIDGIFDNTVGGFFEKLKKIFGIPTRSEERRVGKECRSRRSPDH